MRDHAPEFLDLADVLEIHEQSLADFGGISGIRDTRGNSIRQLEFENRYDLKTSLDLFAKLSASVPPFDFAELKRDFQRRNPIDALIATPVAA